MAATTGNTGQMRAFQDMAAEIGQKPTSRRFDTWKEIASYFGRDERTVRRWETGRGLPIHRVPGGAGGTVYAFEAELAAWLRGNPENIEPKEPVPTKTTPPASRFMLLWPILAILSVTVAFGIWFTSDHGAETPLATSHDPQAAASYRLGLYEWQTRTPVGLANAVKDFKRAIARDPNFAQAYAGLANSYNLLREYTTMPPGTAYPLAKVAAEKAIALDPKIGEAHAALAFDDFYWSRDVRGARREFLSALALEPSSAAIHHWYATFLMTNRAFAQALVEIEKAEALESSSSAILADKGLILFYDGKGDEAVALLRRLEQAQPDFLSPHQYLSSIYRAQGDDKHFLAEIGEAARAQHSETGKAVADAGMAGIAAGGRAKMFSAMLDVEKRLYAQGKISAYELAVACADAGDEPNAIAYLRVSLSRRETENVALAVDPAFEDLRAKPEFQPLLSMAGLASHA
ncbi:MAG TPA: hypothetical protein VGC27_00755 [Rhizomicrobium sp.]